MISKREAPAPEQIEMHKHQRYLTTFSEETVGTGLTGGKITSVMKK